MKSKQNMNLFLILFMISMKLYGSENENFAAEFPAHASEKYTYDFVIQPTPNTLSNLLKQPTDETTFSDKISKHYFNDGITRKKITLKAHDGTSTMTTETWTSRNPSYMTRNNALAVGAGIIVLPITAVVTTGVMLAIVSPERAVLMLLTGSIPLNHR